MVVIVEMTVVIVEETEGMVVVGHEVVIGVEVEIVVMEVEVDEDGCGTRGVGGVGRRLRRR